MLLSANPGGINRVTRHEKDSRSVLTWTSHRALRDRHVEYGAGVSYFKRERLAWIGEALRIFGYINRAHIIRKFEVSLPQASMDIQDFMKENPGVATYDSSLKSYVMQQAEKYDPIDYRECCLAPGLSVGFERSWEESRKIKETKQ